MCGIAGVLNSDSSATVDPVAIGRMCAVIRHRGPDDEGIHCCGPVGLGVRRLSIIGVATGHMPIHNEDRSVSVVFNGEIYNFKELRSLLEGRGHRFSTSSDTEVIVHLYEEDGIDFVTRLRGMFAIALWDKKLQRLVLVRDRLGIKPLYYSYDGNRLVFGSELKSLLQAAGPKPAINLQGLNAYLSFGYVPDPETIFAGMKKLPPGCLLIAHRDKVEVRKFWELPWPEYSKVPSEQECGERIYELLQESVKLRLMSEVPLGALLSGGFDSSTVVALMSRLSDKPVKTFSIGFAEQDFSEVKYARAVAQRFQTDHHELIVTPQAADLAHRLVGYFDEPFGDPSAIPTYLVSELAHQSITVALSGDGGDELFAGYLRYAEAKRQQTFDWIPRRLRTHVLSPLSDRLPYGTRGSRYLRRIAAKDGLARYFECAVIPHRTKKELVSNELRAEVGELDSFPALGRAVLNGHGGTLLDKLTYLDTVTELPGDILTKVDRMSMAHSLEVRVPLLDHVFVEYVARLPIDYKLRGMTTKYLFKKTFNRLLPQEVSSRGKMGFALPLRHWFKSDLRDFLRDVLFDSKSLQRGYFRPAFLETLVREQSTGRRDHSYLLWSLLALELWHRHAGC